MDTDFCPGLGTIFHDGLVREFSLQPRTLVKFPEKIQIDLSVQHLLQQFPHHGIGGLLLSVLRYIL